MKWTGDTIPVHNSVVDAIRLQDLSQAFVSSAEERLEPVREKLRAEFPKESLSDQSQA